MIQRLANILTKPHIAIVWTVVILGLCSIPRQEMPDGMGSDKLHHFGAFGILGALWYWTKPKPFLVILGGTTYGFFIEIWQHLLPIGRTFDLYDGLADAIGVIVAIPIAHWLQQTFFS
jgi:hypothetical protein